MPPVRVGAGGLVSVSGDQWSDDSTSYTETGLQNWRVNEKTAAQAMTQIPHKRLLCFRTGTGLRTSFTSVQKESAFRGRWHTHTYTHRQAGIHETKVSQQRIRTLPQNAALPLKMTHVTVQSYVHERTSFGTKVLSNGWHLRKNKNSVSEGRVMIGGVRVCVR